MNPQLRLQKWREGLLDLTRRNRLIHFNPDVSPKVRSPHGVQLAKPDIETLWNRLALHEKLQGFYELESEAETLDGDEFNANLFEPIERAPAPERPLQPNELRAFPDGAKLSRTLSNLRTRAQTSLTEQGLNTLFVAFGFLRWRDKDNRELLSPLFLVPVELLRKSPRDPFKMRGLGEEAVLNPALQLKLKNDFGLELPADVPTVEGAAGRSVEAQLRQIEGAVRARFAQWRVEPLVFLGLFSFHKIAMFNDLGDNSAPLAAHRLVRAVCGEQGALASHEIIAAEQLDGLPAAEAQLVVEADSSQHRAIVAARRGCSFVLQGPPGTGKSQTITNIIAECLENGKTVLFVSEKMAALDVVLGRLRDIGLGDSCLELHSSKTNKRDVIYEIGRTLMLDAPAPLSSPDESHELGQLRARLAANARQIHQPIAGAGVSLYQAIGRAASFHDAPDLPFRFDEAPFRGAAQLVEIEHWLSELEDLGDVLQRAADHPWRGVHLPGASLEARGRLILACDGAVQNATRLENNWPNLANVWGLDAQIADLKSLDGALQTLDGAARLQQRAFVLHALQSLPDGAIMQRAYGASLRSLTSNSAPQSEQLGARLARWRARYNEEFTERDPRVLAADLTNASWWFERAQTGETLRRDAPVLRRAFKPGDGSLGALSSDVRAQAARLAGELERAAPENFAQSERLAQIVDALGELPATPRHWWTRANRTSATQALDEAQQTYHQRRAAGDALAADWDLPGVLAHEIAEIAPATRAHFKDGFAPQDNRGAETSALPDALMQLRATSSRLAAQLQLPAPNSLAGALELHESAKSIGACALLERAWLDETGGQRARQSLGEARAHYQRRPQLRASLTRHWQAATSEGLARDAEILAGENVPFLALDEARNAWQTLATQGAAGAQNWEQLAQAARECGARWRAQLDETGEWTVAQMSERAQWLDAAARCHPQSVMWLRFKGDLPGGTRALQFEIEAVARATSELAARWKKGASVAAFDASWDAQFVRLDERSAPQLRREWEAIVENGALAAGGDLEALGHSWAQLAASAAQLAEVCGVPAPANARASRELLRVADALDQSAAFPAAWLHGDKLAEIERLWANATQSAQVWAEARAHWGARPLVDAEKLPDEILARWPHYGSWFKRLGGAYRADKTRVAALYGGEKWPAHPQIARDLEQLRALRNARNATEAALDELNRALERTLNADDLNGSEIPAQIGAARALAALNQDWTPQQRAFIEGRERASLRAGGQRLRDDFELLKRTVAAMLEGAEARGVMVPHPNAPFAAVAAWLQARAALLRPDEFSPALVKRDFETATQLAARRQNNAPRLQTARALFGALWNDGQPDWAQLTRAVAQFERARALRVWPAALAQQLFGNPQASEGARELENCAASIARYVAEKLESRAPAQFVGPDASWMILQTALHSLNSYVIAGWSVTQLERGASEINELRAIESAIERDQTVWRDALGARFAGETSDWDALETALQSARAWTLAAPNARIVELLTGPVAAKTELQTGALGAAIENWKGALNHAMLVESGANCGQFPDETADFDAVTNWLAARALHRRPREFTFAAWDEMQRVSARYLELSAHIEAQSARWSDEIGAFWQGADTDFMGCRQTLVKVAALHDWCGEVAEPVVNVACNAGGAARSDTFQSWKSAKDELAQAQERWRAQIAQLSATNWFVPAFFAGQAPQDFPFETLLQNVEQRAPALVAGLAAIEFVSQCAAPNWKWSNEEAQEMLRESAQIRALQAQWSAQEPRLTREFGALYRGLATDWAQIEAGVAELESLVAAAGADGLSAAFRAQLAKDAGLGADYQKIAELRAELEGALKQIAAAFPHDEIWQQRARLGLGQIRSRLSAKIRARDDLEVWLRFVDLTERGRDLGVASSLESSGNTRFLDLLIAQGVAADQLKRTFWKRFWALWLHDLAPHHAALRAWNGAAHAAQTRHFVGADERSQTRAALALQAQLAARRPDLSSDYSDEIRLILHEAGKMRRHIALRQLLAQAGATVQKIKPCFLMSPLSVAHFLEWNATKFDVVVFDEASQICPEDAIGAIGRAAQMIVVGDKQQLPPTRIFAQSALEDEFDDDETDELTTSETPETPVQTPANDVQNGDVESILAFCETAGLPQLSLLWHYRSRHEELIAFSNRHFYDARLQTFPAPARAGSGALQWIKVGGFYRPSGAGAGREGGTNRIEARHVAKMVADHANQTPHLSLGIITFNEPQRRAVEEEITRLRLRDDELDAFLDEDADEPFFVKALENVQGDERDAIFFSVGFGPRKGENGQILPMRMTFGPLTKEGGERRLNVAVTRAKHQVKIVTSFDPGDIKVEKLKYKGGKLLRSYLEWASAAKNGASHNGAQNADDLARAVAGALEKRGWKCALHVGLGEYRVDVGVADARAPETMKLGIVLDGPFYTAAATVRDRDRLRPMVLQRLGWDLWPLWSLDCAPSFERQIEKIDAHLRAAR